MIEDLLRRASLFTQPVVLEEARRWLEEHDGPTPDRAVGAWGAVILHWSVGDVEVQVEVTAPGRGYRAPRTSALRSE